MPLRVGAGARVDVRSFDVNATGSLVERFLAVGHELQSQVPDKLVTPIASTRHKLTSAFGWHENGSVRHYVAHVGGRDVGRCAAMVQHRARDAAGRRVGYVGLWECADGDDGEAAAHALLTMATAWLREQGCVSVVGPIDHSTWHGYRFRDGTGDGRPPCLLEPVTPGHAIAQWRAFGFVDDERYFSAEIRDPAEQVELARSLVRELVAGGWRIEQLHMRDWDALLERAHAMSCAEFKRQPHYTPITLDDFRATYEPLRRGIDPRFVLSAWAPDGEFAGFVLGAPQIGVAARAMAAGGLRGKMRAARAMWANDTVMVKTICVAKRYRALGIAIFLQHALYAAAMDTGHPKVLNMLMHVNNRSRFLTEAAGGVEFRSYVTLRMPLVAGVDAASGAPASPRG